MTTLRPETIAALETVKLHLAKADQATIERADQIIESVTAGIGNPEALYHLLRWHRAGYPVGEFAEAIGLMMAGIIQPDEVDGYIAECQAEELFG